MVTKINRMRADIHHHYHPTTTTTHLFPLTRRPYGKNFKDLYVTGDCDETSGLPSPPPPPPSPPRPNPTDHLTMYGTACKAFILVTRFRSRASPLATFPRLHTIRKLLYDTRNAKKKQCRHKAQGNILGQNTSFLDYEEKKRQSSSSHCARQPRDL